MCLSTSKCECFGRVVPLFKYYIHHEEYNHINIILNHGNDSDITEFAEKEKVKEAAA